MSWGVATQNGVSVSLTSIVSLSAGVTEFSPADLFTGGVQGAWYDPSDYSTLFQDSAGTTPVTAVEQPVGLMLDKSQGLVLGPELVTNGTFTTDTTGWTVSAGTFTSVSGQGQLTGAAPAIAGTSFTTIAGKFYVLVMTQDVNSAIRIGNSLNGSEVLGTTNPGSGTTTRYFVAASTTTWITLRASSTTNYDNISVRELPGNHASQATAASRPVLRARYNNLTYSEQFDNAAWNATAGNSTVSANQATAPDGTLTADLVYPTTTGSGRTVYQTISGQTGTVYTTSVRLKAAGIGFAYVYNVQGNQLLYVNLSTGATSNVGSNINNLTSSIAADGWVTVSFNSTLTTGTIVNIYIGPCDASGSTAVTKSGTSGIYIWGADLRTGSSAGTYQRIAAATDYATAGFLPYLALDGTDDSFGTNSINFTATDKMSVCAGVTKLSDAALGMIIELSANANSNNGTFWIAGPAISGGGPQYGMVTRGNISASAAGYAPTTYSAPITNTVTTLFNLAGTTKAEVVIPRINGVVDQGEPDANALNNGGTFLSYPLYIGRRNNSTFPFNGRIYQLIVCGKELSASELASTEAYVNSKTGAY